ncbi:MAG: glutathione S-transferase family protein [Gammaproteobacteria bacterium]
MDGNAATQRVPARKPVLLTSAPSIATRRQVGSAIMSEPVSDALIVYGGGASQPTRAVWWTCLIKNLAFEACQAGGHDLARINPKRQVPAINDAGFVLYEMPAILVYLAEKHGWIDLYPDELQARARVNQYLNFHHTTPRLATFQLMGPHVTPALGPAFGVDSLDPLMVDTIMAMRARADKLTSGRQAFAKQASIVECGYFFDDAPFLCGTRRPTIADIACYQELAQLQWAGLFDFSPFPRIQGWLGRMAELPFHDVAHAYNIDLGDISADDNTMERFTQANEAAARALAAAGVTVRGNSGAEN